MRRNRSPRQVASGVPVSLTFSGGRAGVRVGLAGLAEAGAYVGVAGAHQEAVSGVRRDQGSGGVADPLLDASGIQGVSARMSAAWPATNGDAMEVPLQ